MNSKDGTNLIIYW